MEMVVQLIGCGAAAALFALLFRVPARCIAPASLSAVAGYGVSLMAGAWMGAEWAGVFFGSVVIALISEGLARRLHAPATIFATVAVIPMVPGAGLYQTMLALVQNRYDDAAAAGSGTMLAAGAIALGMAIVTSTVYAATRPRRRDRCG